ncbi:MAG: phosphate regulon sensor histidine kinase PhoR [Methylococcales bacterium]|nr:phosphate regulon sensor histidine kinase PhoR [Methylococcales bacterium]
MQPWYRELSLILSIIIPTALLGLAFDALFPMLWLATLWLLLRQYWRLLHFRHWLSDDDAPAPNMPPERLWSACYQTVAKLKKRHKKHKKKLARLVDQFRKSTEALPDAAVVLDESNHIQWLNKTAMSVLGLKSTDKGHNILNLLRHPEFVSYLPARHYQDAVIIPSPENINLLLSVRVIPYGKGLRLMLAQDVTQLKKMENMRKDFVANVSHELRTPLTVLKGYLETLKDLDDGDYPLISSSLSQMQNQTERMQHMVDDLLLLTRLETQKKKSRCVDIPELLRKICQEGNDSQTFAQRVNLALECDTKIEGVEEDLRGAISNLLANALKYSPDNTPVTLRWWQDNEVVYLDVIDQGEGIAKADIPRVTERFYRVERQRDKRIPGTGLGLAIVKHVLQNHGAKLVVTSEPGQGSCFRCRFPKICQC